MAKRLHQDRRFISSVKNYETRRKELSQPAPTRNKQKDTLGEKWTRAVLSQSTETMRRINIIYKEPKSPSQPTREPARTWEITVETNGWKPKSLKKSMETTTQTKRQMSNVKNREPKQDTKETTKRTDATITSANKNERMHGRQRPKELEGGGRGHQDKGISCIEPPQQQTLRATMPHGCGTVTMYNKVCFMHLFAHCCRRASCAWLRSEPTDRSFWRSSRSVKALLQLKT